MTELEIDTPTGINASASDLISPTFDRFVYTSVPLESTFFCLGAQHILAVHENTLYSCGSNDENQLGIGERPSGPSMINVTDFTLGENRRIIKIGCSDTCSFVLLDDASIWGFGTLRVLVFAN